MAPHIPAKLHLSALSRSYLHLLQREMGLFICGLDSRSGFLICASLPNSTARVVGRAIAGLGSERTFSGNLIIIACPVPLLKRAEYGAYLGNVYGIVSIYGMEDFSDDASLEVSIVS